jgi:uncharacterized protein (DUF427 family)
MEGLMSSAPSAHSASAPKPAQPHIRIEPHPGIARATLKGQIVAESTAALVLREDGYPPRIYFPIGDVRMNLLTATARRTHCPHKGDASYWTVAAGGTEETDVAWAYRTPHDEVAAIGDHIGFADPVVTDAKAID